MAVTEEEVKAALAAVKYPGFSRDIVSFGLLKGIQISDGAVTVQLSLATNEPAIPRTIKTDAEAVLQRLPGVTQAKVLIDIHAPPAGAGAAGVGATRIEGIKHVIAIAERQRRCRQIHGRGESRRRARANEARVGLCDCDIYGRAFRSCSARAIGRQRQKRTRSSRSSSTT
jgi:ATP-binding protein involved in chromosome partitioning